MVVAPDIITISGPLKPLGLAASGDPEQLSPAVPLCCSGVVPHAPPERALRTLGNFGTLLIRAALMVLQFQIAERISILKKMVSPAG